MFEPEDTQEEIERMRAEREQQQATPHTESVPDINKTDDRFWCSCEKFYFSFSFILVLVLFYVLTYLKKRIPVKLSFNG